MADGTSPAVDPFAQARFDVERELVGALLGSRSAALIRSAATIVEPKHFHEPMFGRIFAILVAGIDKNIDGYPLVSLVQSELHADVPMLAAAKLTPTSLIGHCVAYAAPLIAVEGCARMVRYHHLTVLLKLAVEADEADEAEKLAAEMDQLHRAHLQGSDTRESISTIADRLVTAMNTAHMEGSPPKDFAHCSLRDLRRMIGGWRQGRLYIAAGRPGMGKEQPIDTPILTPTGWTTIGAITPGDLVVGRNGKPTAVLSVHPQGVKQSYRVHFSDGTSVECGEEHLWTVAAGAGRKRGQDVTMSLRSLISCGLTRNKGPNRIGSKWKIPIVEPVEYETADTPLPIDPYLLGVLIGDGAISGRDLRFSNPDFDSDIRENASRRLPNGVSLLENRSGACPYFSIRGEGKKLLRDQITALGLNVLSGEKFIPPEYLTASVEQRTDLLRGLMDTDGSSQSRKTNFYTTSARLASDITTLARSLGCVVRQSVYRRDGKPTEYVVRIRAPFCPFLTKRKADQWIKPPISKYITAATKERMVEQVCIKVAAADGLYVTQDFIVTHNTTFALSAALHTAMAGHGVLYFSHEMGRDELVEMALCDLSYSTKRIEYRDISPSKAAEAGYQQRLETVLQVQPLLNSLPFMVVDSGNMTVGQLRAEALRYKQALEAEGKTLGLVVIDHMGLVKASTTYAGNKVAETEEVSRDQKVLAKELKTAVLALCQLSRDVEKREDKRPNLSDLRWSGGIEQDADVVIFCYREEYYLQKRETEMEKEGKRMARLAEVKNRLELLIEKHRGGPTGSVELFCDVGCAVVRDRAREEGFNG